MTKLKNPLAWLHGLIGTFIGGGAGAAGSAVGGMLVDPKQFNLEDPVKLLKLMLITFCFTGISGACTYLAKSPLPQIETMDTLPPFPVDPRDNTKL